MEQLLTIMAILEREGLKHKCDFSLEIHGPAESDIGLVGIRGFIGGSLNVDVKEYSSSGLTLGGYLVRLCANMAQVIKEHENLYDMDGTDAID